MEVQKVTPPIRNSTWVKGILVIEKCMGAEIINGVAESNPTNQKLNLG